MNVQNNNLEFERESIRLGFNPPVQYDILPPDMASRTLAAQAFQLGMKPLASKRATDAASHADKMQKLREKWVRCKAPLSADTSPYEAQESSSYYKVGHVSRFNTWPWYPVKLETTNQAVYTDSVHLSRYPQSTQYHHILDEYGAWADQNLVREKLKKQWNAPKI